MTWTRFCAISHRAARAWVDDRASSMGAALAYYALFSLAPLLLIVVSVAALVFDAQAARHEVVARLRELVGPAGAAAAQGVIEGVDWPRGSWPVSLLGVGLVLAGATTVLTELQGALDLIWRAPPAPRQGVWRLIRARVLSFVLILGAGLLLLMLLLTGTAVAALRRWWSPLPGPWPLLIEVIDFSTSFALLSLLFAMIYKLMPRVPVAWSDVRVGALVTALLFSAGRTLLGLYLGHSAVASGFGAAGSVVALLVWIYGSAQIFLLGAEFTRAWADEDRSAQNKRDRSDEEAIP